MLRLTRWQSLKLRFTKYYKSDKIWWVDCEDTYGNMLFSFDKLTIYNLFQDYPHNLSKEQKAIFDEECPELTRLFVKSNKKIEW